MEAVQAATGPQAPGDRGESCTRSNEHRRRRPHREARYIVDIELGTNTGVSATVSRDLNQLGDIATSSLPHSFPAEECATYGIDPCPASEQVRDS